MRDVFDSALYVISWSVLMLDLTFDLSSAGKYIYIETSYPQQTGDQARILSPDMKPGTYCLG